MTRELPELPCAAGGPAPDADGLVIAARSDDVRTDWVEGNVEHPRVVALQLHHRPRLPPGDGRGLEVEDAHDAVTTRRGQHSVLRGVPHNTDDGSRMSDFSHNAPCRGLCDAGEAVCPTCGNLASAFSAAPRVPLTTVSLAGVHLQPQHLLPSVCAPDEEESRAADRADARGSGAERQAVEQLVLPSKHLAVALGGRDAPELHMAVVGGGGEQVGVVGVEDHVEDGLGVARG
mmetsp:Transcript_45488/g.131712  ORF Transcript_45488/g.131712 Transcript_45488/m.131712 type:complete len:232 (+) Transcript_45488:2157-2852(+)